MIVSISFSLALRWSASVVFFCIYGAYILYINFMPLRFFKASFLEIVCLHLSRQFCPSVLWHCWLGSVAFKNCLWRDPLSGGTLNLTHSLTLVEMIVKSVSVSSVSMSVCVWSGYVVLCAQYVDCYVLHSSHCDDWHINVWTVQAVEIPTERNSRSVHSRQCWQLQARFVCHVWRWWWFGTFYQTQSHWRYA